MSLLVVIKVTVVVVVVVVVAASCCPLSSRKYLHDLFSTKYCIAVAFSVIKSFIQKIDSPIFSLIIK